REQGAEARPAAEGVAGRSPRSSGNLNSAVGEAASREKQHIYVHATWRTGSSFLGELFNQHPDVFYLYEPMWHLWQALYPGDAESLQGALRDMLRSLFRCDFSVLQLYAPPGDPAARPPDACHKYPVVVIKDVRLLDLGVLVPLLRDPGLNLKVVQLFRDPRAVHNSRLKSRQGLLRESIQVLRTRQRGDRFHRVLLAHGVGARPGGASRALPATPRADFFLTGALEVICEAWMRDLLFARGAPTWLRRRYLRLRYEDLVRQPRAQLRRLQRFAGLRALAALDAFALNMTRGAAYGADRPFHLSARDAREAVHAWRERLSREQVRQVEAACAPAMRLLAYPRSGEDGDVEPPEDEETQLETEADGAT
ncbi:hypothetical protein K5549_019627, partial [Capra hircus]